MRPRVSIGNLGLIGGAVGAAVLVGVIVAVTGNDDDDVSAIATTVTTD